MNEKYINFLLTQLTIHSYYTTKTNDLKNLRKKLKKIHFRKL